jgi:APA family basic amino acid/polyamine antiporter
MLSGRVQTKRLFARKSVESLLAELEGADRLHRVLGPWALTAMGIGAIIGTGIFVLTGLAVLEYAVASCAVAHGWSHYFQALIGLYGYSLPGWLSIDPFSASPEILAAAPHVLGIPIVFDAAALGIALLLTVVLVLGIRESSGLNSLIVLLKVGVVLFVIVAGIPHVEAANWTPFFPFGLVGTLAGASYIFFSYIGFDSISTHAEEAKHPDRDVPFAILTSLGVCTLLYVAVAAVLTGMVPYSDLDIHAPVVAAFSSKGLGFASLVIAIGAVAGITSVLLVMMLSQARVLLAMARDGLIPFSVFGAVHPVYRTPHRSTILTGVLVGTVAALVPLQALAEVVNIGTLFAFVIVCAAVLVMRRTRPDVRRPFRTPFVPFVPIAGIIVNLLLMSALGWHNWARLFIWMAIGMVIYALYGYRHSKLAR